MARGCYEEPMATLRHTRWLLVLVNLAACNKWDEEEVGGLRHLSQTGTGPYHGTEGIDLPIHSNENRLLLTVQADPFRSVISKLESPKGDAWVSDTTDVRSSTNAGFVNNVSVLNWPVLDSDTPLSTGSWRATVGVVGEDLTFQEGDFQIDAWIGNDTNDSGGEVEVVFHFAEGLDQDPTFRAALDTAVTTWEEIYGSVGLTLVIEDVVLDGSPPGLPGVSDPDVWRQVSADNLGRVDIVFREIIEEVPQAYGLAGGIPGAIGSTANSGILVSAALAAGTDGVFSTEETRILAETLAHETGHYLGLFHPVEIGWDRWDAIDDTDECDNEAFCAEALDDNLMFPYPVCALNHCIPQTVITDQQGRTAQRWTGLHD